MPHASAIVVGAGIMGLALARALALRGRRVVVFERHERAVGASLRNGGAVIPLAAADPVEQDRARRSAAVWREFCAAADIWLDPCGSLVPAVDADEWAALQQFAARSERADAMLLDPAAARRLTPWLVARGLRGALHGSGDLVIDPRVALRQLPSWLATRHDIEFRWKHAVTRIAYPYVWSGGRRHAADTIYVAAGGDSGRLLPAPADTAVQQRQRLLVRFAAQPDGFRLGAIVASAASLALPVRDTAIAVPPAWRMVQGGSGEILLDTEFGDGDPMRSQRAAIDAARRLVELPDMQVAQSWVLPQFGAAPHSDAIEVAPGVVAVVAAAGGLGMTTAFGLAEDLVDGSRRGPQAGSLSLSARRA